MDPDNKECHLWLEPQILKDWVMDLKAKEFLISRIDAVFGWGDRASYKPTYIYIIGLFIFFHCQLTCFNEMQKILLSRIFIMRSMMMTVSWRMIIIGKSSSKRWMQLDHTAWHVGSPKPYPKQMHQRQRICGRISRCLRKTSKFLSICVPLPSLTNCS